MNVTPDLVRVEPGDKHAAEDTTTALWLDGERPYEVLQLERAEDPWESADI